MKQLLWYLLAGTRGGPTRARILASLKEKPQNTNQLSEELEMDYKTIQHHIRTLEKNQIITALTKGRYAKCFVPTDQVLETWQELGEIWDQSGKSNINNGGED